MSINKTTLQKMVKQYAQQDIIVEIPVSDKTVNIKVNPVLSLADFCVAAQTICDMQFVDDENGNERYVPYLREFAERFALVQYFTDIDLNMLKKGDDTTYQSVEPIWQFLWSGAYDKIVSALYEHTDKFSYWPLLGAASDMIDDRREKTKAGPAKLWAELDELVAQIKQSFGEMTPEDLEQTREVIEKLTRMDEGKIVDLMRK